MSRFLQSEKPKSLTPTYKVVLDPARLYRPFGLPKNVQHESTRKGMEDSGIPLSLVIQQEGYRLYSTIDSTSACLLTLSLRKIFRQLKIVTGYNLIISNFLSIVNYASTDMNSELRISSYFVKSRPQK